MNPWMLPDWCNALRHPSNVAELCEGETPMAVCTPYGNPKLSKRCSDFPEGVALTRAMCLAAVAEHES